MSPFIVILVHICKEKSFLRVIVRAVSSFHPVSPALIPALFRVTLEIYVIRMASMRSWISFWIIFFFLVCLCLALFFCLSVAQKYPTFPQLSQSVTRLISFALAALAKTLLYLMTISVNSWERVAITARVSPLLTTWVIAIDCLSLADSSHPLLTPCISSLWSDASLWMQPHYSPLLRAGPDSYYDFPVTLHAQWMKLGLEALQRARSHTPAVNGIALSVLPLCRSRAYCWPAGH